jgi:outer membrane beta-barrel protein
MSPRRPAPLLLAVALAAAGLPRAAAASKADAFEGKIQPVSGQLYQKAGRVELTLGGDLSLNDAFFQKRLGDAKLGYHFTEHWAASLHGAWGAAVPTDSTTVCPTGQGCHAASEAQLYQVPGRIHGLFGVEGAWSPIYGKLNTFSEKVAHLDLSVLAGVDWILHDEVLSAAAATAGETPATLRTLGFHVGLGLRVFFAEAFAVRFELKDYVYGVTVPNGPQGVGSADVQNQIMAELGVSVFFPFQNRSQP